MADAFQNRIHMNDPRTYDRCFVLQGWRREACFVVQPKLAAPCQSVVLQRATNVEWLGNGRAAAFIDVLKEQPCFR